MSKETAENLVENFFSGVWEWLDNTAADVVQQYLGYDAREAIIKASCRAYRENNNIRVIAQVYYCDKKSASSFDKITMEGSSPVAEFDDDFLQIITKQGELIQEKDYKE